jgi:hypothetical protein
MGPRGRCLLACLLLWSAFDAAPAPAARRVITTEPVLESEPDAIWLSLGGQAAIASYSSFLKLGIGYQRWLKSRLWLDLGLTALVQADTNVGLLGGVRWWFGRGPGARPFVRAHLEAALLHDRTAGTGFALTPRGGGGIGYFPSAGFGLIVEANVGLGMAFADGVHLSAAVDILVGAEFRF